jgi:hypothetical protein
MKFNVFILVLSLAITGCGRKVEHSSQERTMSKVEALLDDGQFEKAIEKLEAIRLTSPNDEEIKIKLLHSYAGAGGFEALKVMSIWQEIEVLLKEYKTLQEKKIKASVKDGLDNLAIELEKLLAPIPKLTSKQKVRLTQAIDLYHELGFKIETAGKYNNFKWGSLHIYRLAVNLKEMVQEAKKLQTESDEVDLKAIEKAIIPRLKTLGQDIFMAYKLYSNSFAKIKKITASLDKIIAKTINDDNFRLKVNTLAQSEGEFFKSLMKDNIHAASVLLRKLGDIYQENGHKEKLETLIKTALPSDTEIKDTEARIEILVKLFIENFSSDHPEIEEKLKSIFTEGLKQEILTAAKESIKLKNTQPLQELLVSKKPEVEIINSFYLILKGDISSSDIEENIKEEVESLRKKVDLEMLKNELKTIALNLREDSKVVELGVDAVLHKNRDQLIEREKVVQEQIKWIEEYLGKLSEGLKESLNSENPDKEEVEKIVQDTKAFVES